MMLDVLLAVVCLASTSLGATFVHFRQFLNSHNYGGRCAMKSVRQKTIPEHPIYHLSCEGDFLQ